jgi:hypothetical protein
MAYMPSTLTNRLEGRLFSDQGRLHLILDVDTDAGLARVSFRADDQQQITQMPIADVCQLLATVGPLKLDGLNAEDTAKRVIEEIDGWYFTTREGPEGPYDTADQAKTALSKFILAIQSTNADTEQRRSA